MKVKAEDINDLTSDHLQLYFQKDGDVKEDVEILEEEQAAIVTFSDPVGRYFSKKDAKI